MISANVYSAVDTYWAKNRGLYAGYAQWYADLPKSKPILEEPFQAMKLETLDTAKSELARLLNAAPGLFKKKFGDTSKVDFFASFSKEPVDEVSTEATDDGAEEEYADESLLEKDIEVWYGWKKGVHYEDVRKLPLGEFQGDAKTVVATKGVVVTTVVDTDANENVCGGWKLEQENW